MSPHTSSTMERHSIMLKPHVESPILAQGEVSVIEPVPKDEIIPVVSEVIAASKPRLISRQPNQPKHSLSSDVGQHAVSLCGREHKFALCWLNTPL
ncbi:hypothetical protein CEXT_762641 [Caerostris extrusa]|uniref:Uncharacterized protein n=1 Tax=Caerostris extrusa TaxID=172846 RepID=A0AAV4S4V3_CAEEX|nr:hypothetical protein CEXT_762641 [Caerostris extrusa]